MMNKDHGLVFRSFIYLFKQLGKKKHILVANYNFTNRMQKYRDKNITVCGVFNVISSFVEKFNYFISENRKDDATFVIKASYLEIYNEKVKQKYRKYLQNKTFFF